eukprot:7191939-Heterocapsa_arctica.AAC.1
MDITTNMVIDPDELSADRVTTRLGKAETDHTTMVGMIANGNEDEVSNKVIFAQIVGNYPYIFDSLI